MNEADKVPEKIVVPIIAAVVLHALAPVSDPSKQEKIDAAFSYADAFAQKLRERGMLGK